jgi:hypothetical protein
MAWFAMLGVVSSIGNYTATGYVTTDGNVTIKRDVLDSSGDC